MIAESDVEAKKLPLHELCVEASACQQLGVRALLDYAAFLDDDDPIGLLHRAQTMCNDHHCATLEVLVKGFLYL